MTMRIEFRSLETGKRMYAEGRTVYEHREHVRKYLGRHVIASYKGPRGPEEVKLTL